MAFTLAHLSDPHLPPLPKPRFRELAGKRVLGYLNWTRNRHKYYRREVLDSLVGDLHYLLLERRQVLSPFRLRLD